MCRILGISRSTYYYKAKDSQEECSSDKHQEMIEESVQRIFKKSRCVYGARKIKKALAKEEIHLSRRKARQIMKKYNLISAYQTTHYKPYSKEKNENSIPNKVNREFSNRYPLEVIVSDLTYVRIQKRWAYACIIIDLFNREITFIGGITKGFMVASITRHLWTSD
ncbi:IS3 family transposase [Streptococcus sp. 19428wA2_WM07]|nr:IS3 family transposase [Streptococcus sp. 19428wA2_WM07]TFU28183.1 hypothetical protein E4T71_05445 [Streptococcus sp. WM07]